MRPPPYVSHIPSLSPSTRRTDADTTPSVDNRGDFEQHFDFSKLPNLKDVELLAGWMGGSLLWIPKALSTIKPATSPRLSLIKLSFVRPPFANRSIEDLIKDAGDDIRWVVDEIARIEREFGAAVDLTVDWDRSFRVALVDLM